MTQVLSIQLVLQTGELNKEIRGGFAASRVTGSLLQPDGDQRAYLYLLKYASRCVS
jgi:hypothetical protein